MIAAFTRFDVRDEVHRQLADTSVARQHIQKVVEGCRKIPGLKEKFFVMDPETNAHGPLLLWERQEDLDAYFKSTE